MSLSKDESPSGQRGIYVFLRCFNYKKKLKILNEV